MNMTKAATTIFMSSFLAGGTSAAPEQVAPERKPDEVKKPNILFIMTDQQFGEAMSCRMGRQCQANQVPG